MAVSRRESQRGRISVRNFSTDGIEERVTRFFADMESLPGRTMLSCWKKHGGLGGKCKRDFTDGERRENRKIFCVLFNLTA